MKTIARIFALTLVLILGPGARAAEGWSAAGSLATARFVHTATLLPSGRVLIAGGTDGGGTNLASTEQYDPATNAWSAAGSLATGRYFHTATLLPGGKVLVSGGTTDGNFGIASAEQYDPATNAWSAAGNLTMPRYWHTATLLPGGKVLVAGGYGSSPLASAALYNPATNAWSAAGSLATGHYLHTATLLPSGKVLIVAGGGNSGPLASAELYNPATNTWSAAGSLATARYYHTATLLPGGRVLVAGGEDSTVATLASAELYDPATNTWSAAGSLTTGRYLHPATLLLSGKVLAAGGSTGPYLASAELYNPATNAWSATGSLATARYWHTATLLPGGKVLAVGGRGAPGTLASAELYNPGPTGGTFVMDKALVRPGQLITATFSGWTGGSLPLSYQVKVDGVPIGAPSGSPTIGFGFAAPDGPHVVTGRVVDDVGNYSETTQTITMDGTPPDLADEDGIEAVATDPAGVAVYYTSVATDNLDPAPVITQTPPSGTVFPVGTTAVTVRATDWAGNWTEDAFPVTVTRAYVEANVVASAGKLNGSLVGTALEGDEGNHLYTLGTPTLTNLRRIVVTGTAKNSGTGKTLAGVLLGKPLGDGTTRWTMPLRAGDAAHEAGLVWKSFPREPFMDYTDDALGGSITSPGLVAVEMGFYARVSGPGVTFANDDVLGFYSLPEVGDEVLVAVAREGGDAAGVPGGKFKSIVSAAIARRPPFFGEPPGTAIAFTAMLQTGPSGTPGPGGVEKANDMGLWFWEDGALRLSLREGQVIDGRTVRSFVALRGPAGHGHGLTADYESYHAPATEGRFTTTVLITFTDGGKRLAVAGSLGTSQLVDENTDMHWVNAGERLPWGRIGSFSRHPYGMTVLLTSLRGVPSTVNSAVLFETGDAESFRRVVKGDPLPGGSVFTALSAPIGNTDYTMAFAGKTNTSVSGAWYLHTADLGGEIYQQPIADTREYFRATAPAPSAGGGVWRRLYANSLPDGMGPLFAAKLRSGSLLSPAPGGVTPSTDLGLWAVDTFGVTHLLIREGGTIAGKTVRNLKVLTPVMGSPAQTHSFNGKRDVLVWVLASDFTQHLVHFAVP